MSDPLDEYLDDSVDESFDEPSFLGVDVDVDVDDVDDFDAVDVFAVGVGRLCCALPSLESYLSRR